MNAKRTIGRSVTRVERLDRGAMARLAVATGLSGNAMPPLAHWAWFLDIVADDALGDDGHPRRGDFLPAAPHLPCRMFAAASIAFEAPLIVDAEATQRMTIADVRETFGRTGALIFVELDQVIEQEGLIRVRERRTIVYRAPGDPTPLPVEARDGAWRPEALHLFRFSAATFNPHRIHYDLPYAQQVEGYPALVVHGPFTACRLAFLAAKDGALATFAFRAQAPLFAGQPVDLRAAGDGRYEAIRCDGVVAMVATATRSEDRASQ